MKAFARAAIDIHGTYPGHALGLRPIAIWDANADEHLASSSLAIEVNGAAGSTIRWVASVRTVEVINN